MKKKVKKEKEKWDASRFSIVIITYKPQRWRAWPRGVKRCYLLLEGVELDLASLAFAAPGVTKIRRRTCAGLFGDSVRWFDREALAGVPSFQKCLAGWYW